MATAQTLAQPPAAPAPVADSAAPKPKSRLPLYVGGLAVVLGLMGAAAWLFPPRFLGQRESAPHAGPETTVKATLPLGSVIVNIAGSEARRYVKVTIELGVANAKDIKEVGERKPQLLDLFVTILSTTTFETLDSGDGRKALKRELLAKIHDELDLKKVAAVYFTEFLIQ
jgi:flagellar FliL protein